MYTSFERSVELQMSAKLILNIMSAIVMSRNFEKTGLKIPVI
jgi:hypothetical protein